MKSNIQTAFIAIAFSFFCTTSFGQNKAHFDLEIDPIAYALKGYSVHLGYQPKSIRFDVGVYGLEEPSFYSINKDFEVKLNGVGLKAAYYGQKAGGWFAGVGADYGFVNATHKTSKENDKGNTVGVGVNGGYRFLLGKAAKTGSGFYITPWLGIDKVFMVNKPMFTAAPYKTQDIRFFPTVHLGWRF